MPICMNFIKCYGVQRDRTKRFADGLKVSFNPTFFNVKTFFFLEPLTPLKVVFIVFSSYCLQKLRKFIS